MRHLNRATSVLACTALLAMSVQAADVPAAGQVADQAAPVQSAVWQRHKVSIDYFGITTAYTCDGLEDKVRTLLRYFGARDDLKVSASCPHLQRPNHQALVRTDFYSLAPADAQASNPVPARWTELRLIPERPSFMDRGECELVQVIKPLLIKNFTLRQVRYDTTCTAHETTLEDYSVKAEALEPISTQ